VHRERPCPRPEVSQLPIPSQRFVFRLWRSALNDALNIGTFVEIDGTSDGIGRVVHIERDAIDVEFFASPVGPTLEVIKVSRALVKPLELSAEMRVYTQNQSVWLVGRVVSAVAAAAVRALRPESPNENHYAVRFPNGKDALLPSSKLFVRWRRPLVDPTDHLAARITETPFFYAGRAAIIKHLADQRAAFGGIRGLASATVDLLQHQITIVRHVLHDPVRRYLLADEVGLGKTIQACALIRQHLLEEPTRARVLVVVPAPLVSQWRGELSNRFFIAERDERVRVVSDDHLPHGNWTLLVVDEAHRYSRWAFAHDDSARRYQQLCDLAQMTPSVLLLSGTPVLDNEDGFLAMLHALDPSSYSLDDVDAFRLRVRDRQAIAEIIADLGDTTPDSFVEDALERANTLLGQDSVLRALSVAVQRSLRASSKDSADARRALRVHISETYRIHRRMLRTRREDPRIREHLPRRTGVIRLPCEDAARIEAFDILDTWRLAALYETSTDRIPEATRLMEALVDAAFSHPTILLRRLDERITELDPGMHLRGKLLHKPAFFEGELDLLRARRNLLAARVRDEPRIATIAGWLTTTPKVRKAVVFVDDTSVANRVYAGLAASLGVDSVHRHTENSLASFEADPRVRVLVCDANAEEGLNLQRVGAAIIHYDLPLSATRIEQRIGRTDRIAACSHTINVVFEGSDTYDKDWLECLEQTIKIFHRSTAPLQYVLTDAISQMRSRFFEYGATAFKEAKVTMQDPVIGLNAELRRIQQQEAIDALETDTDTDQDLFDKMLQADEFLEDNGQAAFERWIVDTLQFVRRTKNEVVRYSFSLNRPTLVPLSDVLQSFRDCINTDEDRSRRELPMKSCTFSRTSAETARVGVVRIGHPLVDAVESLLRYDDRGRTFAMWRVQHDWMGDPRLFLQFDFVIKADLTAAASIARAHSLSVSAVEFRAEEVFSPRMFTVFLDDELAHVTAPELIRILERPYVAQKDGGSDINIRHDRWAAVDAVNSVTDWGEFCARGRCAAETVLRSNVELNSAHSEAARRYRSVIADTLQRLESRLSRLTGSARVAEERSASLEREFGDAIAAGIEVPSVSVEAVGAIFVASVPLAALETA
jgi:ATP-dependent helicase HepA